MSILKSHRIATRAIAALAVVVAVVGVHLLIVAGDAGAHQPDGLSMTPAVVPEPPCPYGHDDGCEYGFASLGYGSAAVDPYQSSDPHALLPNADAGPAWPEYLAGIGPSALPLTADDARIDDGQTAEGKALHVAGGGVNYAITPDIRGLPWIRDGQTPAEQLTVNWLSELQIHNPALASALTRMPFLQDHTPGDLQAIQTLTWISAGSRSIAPDPQYATAITAHAGFADGGGIDNTEAKIIAVMSMPYFDGRFGLIDALAHHGTVEERTVNGQHGNRVNFAVVRPFTSRQNSALMQSALMQSAVSATGDAEGLMGKALPADFVGILVSDLPNAAGANNGIHIQLDAGFDGTYYGARTRQRVVGHEIGHYWWNSGVGHEHWISEGPASYIGAYTEWSQSKDDDVYTNRYPCPYYRTIEHLRADSPEYWYEQSYGSLCNYSLGERLFINLDYAMTAPVFNAAFRNLHQRLSTYERDKVDQGLSLTRAFCLQCLQTPRPRDLGSIGHTLARRYGEKIFTDDSAPAGSIPRLGRAQSAAIMDQSGDNRQYGVPQIPASSPDQRRWVRISFNNATNPPETVKVGVSQYHEDRYPWHSYWHTPWVYSANGQAWFYVYLGAPERRAAGHHWVYIYNEAGQKIAQVEYQVLP